MAKKNTGKNYTGKSYTVTARNDKKTKKDNAKPEKQRRPISLLDTSGVDGYFRPEVSVGRFKLGYEVFMGNFMKMIGLNFTMLLFLVPLFALLFLRYTTIYANASISPFSANMGVGYLPFAAVLGLEESIIYYANYNFFMWLPAAALFLGIGLSGGMYVMRNLCWGESVPVGKTFFQGVKKNILQILLSVVIYSLILSVCSIFISHINLNAAINGTMWYWVVIKVLLYVVIAFFTLHFMAMCSMIVTYKGNFLAFIKNCFVFTWVLLPLNLVFGVLALLPFAILFMGMQALSLAAILIMFLGSSFTMLCWTVYSQWIYDKFINGRVETYKPSEEELKQHTQRVKEKEVASKAEGYTEVGKAASIMDGVKPVTDYEVELSHLNEVFTRDDITSLNNSKTKL